MSFSPAELFVPASGTFTSLPPETLGTSTPLPAGHHRVTVYTNAIPSLQKIAYIDLPECDPERLDGPLPDCDSP